MGIGAKTLAAAGLCASGLLFAQTSWHTSGHHATDMVEWRSANGRQEGAQHHAAP